MTLAFEVISREGDAISTVVVVAGGRFSAEGKGESAKEAKEVASRLLMKSGILPEPMEVEREIVNDEPSFSVNDHHHRAPPYLVEPVPPSSSSSSTPATRPSVLRHEDPSAASSAEDHALQAFARSVPLGSDGETVQQQVEPNKDRRPSTSSVSDPIETEKKKKKKRSSTQLASVDSSLRPPRPIPSTSTISASHPDLPESSSTPHRPPAAQSSSSSLPFDQLSLSLNVDEPSLPSPVVQAKPKPKPKPPTTPSTPSHPAKDDPKKRLTELTTQLGLEPPSFKSKPMRKDKRGVDVFLEKVFVGEHSEKGTGWSKELAQQKACRKMLESGELGGMEGVEGGDA